MGARPRPDAGAARPGRLGAGRRARSDRGGRSRRQPAPRGPPGVVLGGGAVGRDASFQHQLPLAGALAARQPPASPRIGASEEGGAPLADRATEVALFRYSLIRQAADPALSKAQRGRVVRALAAEMHAGPGGDPVRVARGTIDRWIRAWRAGGFEALKPP